MAKMYTLTHGRLTEMLDFDPETGLFTWKVARSNRVKVGSRAGVLHRPSGGRYISIDGEKFMAHRLAFFFVNQRWPNTDVRPLDGDYDNCALANLREVSRVELAHQRETVATNTSGYAGVSRAKFGRWQSKITWNYQQISLGSNFETAEEASEIYEEAARRLAAAASQVDCARIVHEIRLFKRQRAAWKYLTRHHSDHAWESFQHFVRDVTQVPAMKYAMVAEDLGKPIGPLNYRWALPLDTVHSTRDGIVAYQKVKRVANRDQFRDRDFRRKYGIGYADYQKMLVAQKGVCAICAQPETKLQHGEIRLLSVDHDHTTGDVRGLLCGNCNMAIGYACDSVDVLEKAVAYLEKHGAKRPWQAPAIKFELPLTPFTEPLGHG